MRPLKPWHDHFVLAVAMICLLAAGVGVLIGGRRAGRLGRGQTILFSGLIVCLLSLLATPGVAWGDPDSSSGARGASTLIFSIGIAVLVWGALAWRRERQAPDPDPS